MKREEQIISEAKKHYYDDINCHNAFLHGVEWADEHPDLSSLWHSADEEPEGNNWKILCQDEMGGCWVENRVDAMLLHNTWSGYAGIEMLVKWAYIKDLLPKGGEE